jgi:hypothetical protein
MEPCLRSWCRSGTCTVQRIRINPDGTKHSRRMLGIVHDAAMMLDNVESTQAGQCVSTVESARGLGALTIGEAPRLS